MDEVALRLPFRGTWLAVNSPASRVPSHGTHLFATTYAIDFVAVEGRRTALAWDWRTLVATEPPERFTAFGRPILAPTSGRVVAVHDGEPDHEARRSPPSRVAYALTQAGRARAGGAALAGNHVIVADDASGAYVLLAHLREGSLRVEAGDRVTAGQEVGACGNSGNSTQPHVHVQAMDGPDPHTARGLPMTFLRYRSRPRRGAPVDVERGMPDTAEVVEAR